MLFGGVSFDGSILSFDVASGVTETYSDTIPSTCTKVVKTGSGTIEVTGNSVDFHGNVEIKEGVVVATHMNALGRGTGAEGTTSPNTISVSKGAQLRATFAPDKSDGNPE
jgi:autotransporter-associated beta strand protein